jgi:hypothetical protein
MNSYGSLDSSLYITVYSIDFRLTEKENVKFNNKLIC